MQANKAKAMSVHSKVLKALVKSKEIKSKIPRDGSHKLNPLAYIAHLQLGKRTCACITKGFRLCCLKSKINAQTKAWAVAVAAALVHYPTAVQATTKTPE